MRPLPRSTWVNSGHWVYIDDSYLKTRPLSLRPSLACMRAHTLTHTHAHTHTHSLLCLTADMSAVSYSRHVSSVTQQTCLLCDTADMSFVLRSRHVRCVTQQTCLLSHKADMSGTKGSIMDKAPNERVPYEYEYEGQSALAYAYAYAHSCAYASTYEL